MKKTLLGHLYNHIKGSTEDVATMSLQYLLSYYDELRHSFNALIGKKLDTYIDQNVIYDCQSVGDDLERPDMSGSDSSGKEVILCEAKFYAGLTSNQPLTYLKRLKDEGGIGLVFICPKDRVVSLWDTLMNKCKGESVEELCEYRADVNGIRLTILSWEEIIADLTYTANAVEKSSLADIEQLSGYCEQIISEAFVPFKEEELGAYEAKKYERLMYVLDRVVDFFAADQNYSVETKGFNATTWRHGYARYFVLDGLGVSLMLHLQNWIDDKYVDTPYWVGFKTIINKKWKLPESFLEKVKEAQINPSRKAINKNKDSLYLALDVPCGVPEDGVAEGIKRQIIEYLEIFRK